MDPAESVTAKGPLLKSDGKKLVDSGQRKVEIHPV
jgi:hypothetical protein